MVKNGATQPHFRAVVHIGPIKTGSSAFTAQMEASQKRGDLGPNVVYALPRDVTRGDSTTVVKPEFTRYLAPKLQWSRQSGEGGSGEPGSNKVFGERARAYLDDLIAELRATHTSDTTVFFVEETLSRRSGPGNLTDELLSRFDSVDYFFVARAQHNIVPSAISQRVKMTAYPGVWDARVSTYLANENLAGQFDYVDIMKRWASSDKRVRLIPVPFLESDRGTQNLFYRILSAVEVEVDLGEPVRREVNVTPSRFEIAALGMYKRATYRYSRNGLPRGSRRRRAYDAAANLFHAIARIIKSPRWGIDDVERQQILRHYDAANGEFREALGKRVGSPEWTEWFSGIESATR